MRWDEGQISKKLLRVICVFIILIAVVFMGAFVVYLLSRVQLFVIPWTVAHQAPLSMGFLRQEF